MKKQKWHVALLAVVMIASLLLASCGQTTPEVVEVEKKVTVQVEKEVTVQVEKEVKVTEQVEVEVEVTKVVEATPIPEVNEAPVLHEKVLAGELPPLEERLPAEPRVLETFDDVGTYGGTWHRFDTSFYYIGIAQYGHSPIWWVKDGLEKEPGLAKSWEANADKTEWTFYFREGTKWSDGVPFSVDDIIFWYEDLALNQEHSEQVPAWLKAGGEVAELEKIDDYTIKFKFAAPSPLFEDHMSMWPKGPFYPNEALLAPKHYLTQFHPDYSDEYDNFEMFDEMWLWRNNADCPVLNPWMPIEVEPGVRMVLERNPYYYVVDQAGNQLPYIDRVEITKIEDLETSMLKVMGGETEICGRPCKYQPLKNMSTFRQNEVAGGYRTELWDGGSGSIPVWLPNWNHSDPEKQEVFRTTQFRRALSHAVDREKIQKTIYYGTGELTTGTFSPKAIEYHSTERGRDLYQQWRDLAVAFDLEKAGGLLDEIGVVDADGDGWRDLPSGAPFEIRMDFGAENSYATSNEIVKEGWDAIGLKTVLNPVPDEEMTSMVTAAEFDVYLYGELGDGPNHLVYPAWLVPIENTRWAPLYGAWYSVMGTDAEGTELDLDPRDRTPPRAEPAVDDPVARLQELYVQAKSEPDDDKRLALTLDMIQIHVDEGPFFIGALANTPTIVAFQNNVGNVPSREQLGTGGFTNPWIMVYFGIIHPEQFYYTDAE